MNEISLGLCRIFNLTLKSYYFLTHKQNYLKIKFDASEVSWFASSCHLVRIPSTLAFILEVFMKAAYVNSPYLPGLKTTY